MIDGGSNGDGDGESEDGESEGDCGVGSDAYLGNHDADEAKSSAVSVV